MYEGLGWTISQIVSYFYSIILHVAAVGPSVYSSGIISCIFARRNVSRCCRKMETPGLYYRHFNSWVKFFRQVLNISVLLFAIMLSRFTNNGVKPGVANMRSAFE